MHSRGATPSRSRRSPNTRFRAALDVGVWHRWVDPTESHGTVWRSRFHPASRSAGMPSSASLALCESPARESSCDVPYHSRRGPTRPADSDTAGCPIPSFEHGGSPVSPLPQSGFPQAKFNTELQRHIETTVNPGQIVDRITAGFQEADNLTQAKVAGVGFLQRATGPETAVVNRKHDCPKDRLISAVKRAIQKDAGAVVVGHKGRRAPVRPLWQPSVGRAL